MRLVQGDAGRRILEEKNNAWRKSKGIPLFEIEGLYPMVLKSTSNKFRCIILPAFDKTLNPKDSAYKESWMPYRDRSNTDKKTGAFQYSTWFTQIGVYQYFGKSWSTFVAPSEIVIAEEGNSPKVSLPDPIVDLRRYIFRQAKLSGDKTYFNLIQRDENGRTALPQPKTCTLLNYWGDDPNEDNPNNKNEIIPGYRNRVLMLGPMAFKKLLSDLDKTGQSDNPDKNWPYYLYGDPTDPERAIVCKLGLFQLEQTQLRAMNGLDLGAISFAGDRMHVASEHTKITPEMLRGRYDLGDVDHVIHIPSYDEIVELMVEEQEIPYELLQLVCAEKCEHFPARPSGSATGTPQGTQQAPYTSIPETPKKVTPIAETLAAATPQPKVTPTDGLTSEEKLEFEGLTAAMSSPQQMSTQMFNRYTELRMKMERAQQSS